MSEPGRERLSRRELTRVLLRALVPLVFAAVNLALGNRVGAVALLVVATVLTIVSVAAPGAGRAIDRATVAAGHAVATAVALVAAGAIDLLVGVPGRLLGSLRRRSPLTGLARNAESSWRESPQSPRGLDAGRNFGGDLPRRRRPGIERRLPLSSLVRATGVVTIVVLLDVLLGAATRDTATTRPAGDAVFEQHTRLSGLHELAPVDGRAVEVHPFTRPAAFEADWVGSLRRAETLIEYHWEPFVTIKAVDTAGPLVNITDGVRRSWTAPGDAAGRPVVWFFGGSTMQGIGQRDDHTIPSEVARLAAAAGTPIEAVNFGVTGAVNFSEVLQMEQQLAVRPAPDVVVFYDGAGDVGLQSFFPSDQPTTTPLAVAYRSADPSLLQQWRDASLVTQLVRRADRAMFAAAGASTAPLREADPARVARATLGVYQRGIDLANGVLPPETDALYFWQPVGFASSSGAWEQVRRGLPAEVVDISDALDGARDHVYVDDVHTDESGARLVAERMWPTIADRLR